ncbi:DegT/DnrJ/EryC1/StrS family aminotransferase [Acidobacteria bacterium ACD]|nr:MAG: DegT/DnrJ/EryC1/StrS family aminotransferase [Acidobacteriota bacterium]MCE7956320.1 DegT/DnrJ/EryC1/StrS family aminotransferase [Acidobacteria bacterium ACB2]MDL1948424.1 DegT/DnrJ/EryC1/StrS family aminotransferase [Acidobacteria bacterium ACD]
MIPVFDPSVSEEDVQAVVEALRRGEISGSFGRSIPEFEESFAAFVGSRHGVAVSSGTTALHLAVAAAGIGPGDEVLVSASTNIATALAAVHNGALPVPVDSEAETWNLDLDRVEPLIGSRTRAIVPVHLFGHPVDMDRLTEIARRNRLVVIEDCAESHGATCRGRVTGSFGDMGCFSFYANKIVTTGEGGMVVTNDDALAERLRLLRNLGFTQPRFRHEVAGYNFRMTGYQAAMGVSQVRRIGEILEAKRAVASRYSARLRGIPGLRLPVEKEWARNVYWMYGVVVEPEFGLGRDELAAFLRAEGIETRTFFCPMNQQPCLRRLPGFRAEPCPVADRLWETGLYLPSSPGLSESSIDRVADAIGEARKRRGVPSAAR